MYRDMQHGFKTVIKKTDESDEKFNNIEERICSSNDEIDSWMKALIN
jgi:hypothetical protein